MRAGKCPTFLSSRASPADQTVLALASGPTENWNSPQPFTPKLFTTFARDSGSPVPISCRIRCFGRRSVMPRFEGLMCGSFSRKGQIICCRCLSSYTFYPLMRQAGVKIWRYQRGFMHQKVLLADDDLAIIGSVILDFRSFMLNFELSAVIQDTGFAKTVEKMLEKDFARSEAENLQKFEKGKFSFRLKCRLAALMSPEQ